ncbi:AMP-binding protein [Leekyejoonella antrihumi]|uniref:AMP-binding protein n=1 Tax=Leekyejoonella antrihumi TaxID=1660198 RepID=UPI001C962EE0|nr:AMP-binding protein [Leekyejoonella antrihumi]
MHTVPFAYLGACSVIMESFTPERWLDVVETYRVTKAFLVPAMWAAVAQSPSLAARDLDSLTFAISGGAPCPIVVIKALQAHGMAFAEGFGMTETAPGAACLQPEDVLEHSGSIGRPVPHMDFRLVDQSGHEVPVGEVGELTVRGPNVFVGYWDDPVATEEAFDDGWFHTGDLGVVDEDGFYRLVDRLKDMIITGGENVYPIEVEQVIYEHPDVVEVAVVGVPDDQCGELVIGIVVTTQNSDLTGDTLVRWTRERIAHYKAPRRIEFVTELPPQCDWQNTQTRTAPHGWRRPSLCEQVTS